MAIYPAALPTIPDDGTWNHAQVAREVEAVATELGVNPSGTQTDVTARFVAAEGRITAVEGATTTAGVEVASAQLTTDYAILGQAAGNTTWGDVSGLSIAAAAQTRAYDVTLTCTFVLTTNSSFAGPKYLGASVRIVDSTVSTILEVSQIPLITIASGVTTLFAKGYFMGRVAAGQAATTWKVQTRLSATPDANIASVAIYAGTEAATTGVSRRPALLQAITV
jgi:hypothetical protein